MAQDFQGCTSSIKQLQDTSPKGTEPLLSPPASARGGGGFKEIKTRGVLRPPGRDKTHGDRGCGKCPGMRRGCPEPKIYKLGGKPPRGGPGAGAGQAGRREAGPPSPSPRGRGRGRGGGDGGGSPGKAARAAPPLGLEVCCWKGREKKREKRKKNINNNHRNRKRVIIIKNNNTVKIYDRNNNIGGIRRRRREIARGCCPGGMRGSAAAESPPAAGRTRGRP